MSKAANLCGLVSAIAFGVAPVRQICARIDYWRLQRYGKKGPEGNDKLMKAAEAFTIRDGVRFNLLDTIATAIGVVLLGFAFLLELLN